EHQRLPLPRVEAIEINVGLAGAEGMIDPAVDDDRHGHRLRAFRTVVARVVRLRVLWVLSNCQPRRVEEAVAAGERGQWHRLPAGCLGVSGHLHTCRAADAEALDYHPALRALLEGGREDAGHVAQLPGLEAVGDGATRGVLE